MATTTELEVGDMVTLTLIITNTGKLYFHRSFGTLDIFLEDNKTYQLSSSPILEQITPKSIDFATNVYPEESASVNFILRAVRSGTVMIKGIASGEVYRVPYRATLAGESTAPLRIRVYPANP